VRVGREGEKEGGREGGFEKEKKKDVYGEKKRPFRDSKRK